MTTVITKKHFIANSPYTGGDDHPLIEFLIHNNIITTYKCNAPKCKVAKTWHGAPIGLILTRKDRIHTNLKPDNLELLCPNCHSIQYGKRTQTIVERITCQYCNWDITLYGTQYTSVRTCKVCTKKKLNKMEHDIDTAYYEALAKFEMPTPHISTTKTNKHYSSHSKPKPKLDLEQEHEHEQEQQQTSVIPLNLDISIDDFADEFDIYQDDDA